MKGMGSVLCERVGWNEARRSRGSEWMVGQDAPIVIDDQEFEPAPEHRLAVGEQHLPAEGHNVAAKARARCGAKANALAPGVLCGGREVEFHERGISARPVMAGRVRRPERGDGA